MKPLSLKTFELPSRGGMAHVGYFPFVLMDAEVEQLLLGLHKTDMEGARLSECEQERSLNLMREQA